MPFASSFGEGLCEAFPDTCKTPAGPAVVPIPYPNIAELAMADPGTCSEKVMIVCMPAATTDTQILMSEGDDAGVEGGVISGMISGPCKFVLGSSIVMIGGQPAVFMGSTIGQNGVSSANAPMGVQVMPSQEIVQVAP
jgi:uncharacterized Zn-binding protein involved in type VI secretion